MWCFLVCYFLFDVLYARPTGTDDGLVWSAGGTAAAVGTFSSSVSSWTSPLYIILIGLVTASLFLFGCLCCNRRKATPSFREFRNSTQTLHPVGFVNPLSTSPEVSIFPPPISGTGGSAASVVDTSQPHSIISFEPLPTLVPPHNPVKRPPAYNEHLIQQLSMQHWFDESEFHFPRQQLHYVKEIGRGWFGKVVEGDARGLEDLNKTSKVFVRLLKEDAAHAEKLFFLHEAKPYKDLRHPNILRLMATCLEADPFLLIFESCPRGDLKEFLLSNESSRDVLIEQGITIKMAIDVATGLSHMIEHDFIHTDVSARNCLVSSDLRVKIGDYGISIDKYKPDYYVNGEVALPIRWCAPESLQCTDTAIHTCPVTEKCNVWSFGVLLWEIFEFGKLPYHALSDDQVITQVFGEQALKLTPPSIANSQIVSIMEQCWRSHVVRPTMKQVLADLTYVLMSPQDSHDEFNRKWGLYKPNRTLSDDRDSGMGSGSDNRKSMESFLDSECSNETSNLTKSSPHIAKSPSLENFMGSLENLHEQAWLQNNSTNATNSSEELEDQQFIHGVSKVIKDLDDVLALEKTSSSEDSKDTSPVKQTSESVSSTSVSSQHQQHPLDFKLGPVSEHSLSRNFSSQLGSLKSYLDNETDSLSLPFILRSNDGKTNSAATAGAMDDNSLLFRTSDTDTEDELWRKRIEKCEFSEKVKEKSKSVADLMILTHIDPSTSGSSENSLEMSQVRQPSLVQLHSRKGSMRRYSSDSNILDSLQSVLSDSSLKQIDGKLLSNNGNRLLSQPHESSYSLPYEKLKSVESATGVITTGRSTNPFRDDGFRPPPLTSSAADFEAGSVRNHVITNAIVEPIRIAEQQLKSSAPLSSSQPDQHIGPNSGSVSASIPSPSQESTTDLFVSTTSLTDDSNELFRPGNHFLDNSASERKLRVSNLFASSNVVPEIVISESSDHVLSSSSNSSSDESCDDCGRHPSSSSSPGRFNRDRLSQIKIVNFASSSETEEEEEDEVVNYFDDVTTEKFILKSCCSSSPPAHVDENGEDQPSSQVIMGSCDEFTLDFKTPLKTSSSNYFPLDEDNGGSVGVKEEDKNCIRIFTNLNENEHGGGGKSEYKLDDDRSRTTTDDERSYRTTDDERSSRTTDDERSVRTEDERSTTFDYKGSIVTPDDDRSCDSGFRDKGSLSDNDLSDTNEEINNIIDEELKGKFCCEKEKMVAVGGGGGFGGMSMMRTSEDGEDHPEDANEEYNLNDIEDGLFQDLLTSVSTSSSSSSAAAMTAGTAHPYPKKSGWYLHEPVVVAHPVDPTEPSCSSSTTASGPQLKEVTDDCVFDESSVINRDTLYCDDYYGGGSSDEDDDEEEWWRDDRKHLLNSDIAEALRRELSEKLPGSNKKTGDNGEVVEEREEEMDEEELESVMIDSHPVYLQYPKSLSPILEESETEPEDLLEDEDELDQSSLVLNLVPFDKRNSLESDSTDSEEEEQVEDYATDEEILFVDTQSNEAVMVNPKDHQTAVMSPQSEVSYKLSKSYATNDFRREIPDVISKSPSLTIIAGSDQSSKGVIDAGASCSRNDHQMFSSASSSQLLKPIAATDDGGSLSDDGSITPDSLSSSPSGSHSHYTFSTISASASEDPAASLRSFDEKSASVPTLPNFEIYDLSPNNSGAFTLCDESSTDQFDEFESNGSTPKICQLKNQSCSSETLYNVNFEENVSPQHGKKELIQEPVATSPVHDSPVASPDEPKPSISSGQDDGAIHSSKNIEPKQLITSKCPPSPLLKSSHPLSPSPQSSVHPTASPVNDSPITSPSELKPTISIGQNDGDIHLSEDIDTKLVASKHPPNALLKSSHPLGAPSSLHPISATVHHHHHNNKSHHEIPQTPPPTPSDYQELPESSSSHVHNKTTTSSGLSKQLHKPHHSIELPSNIRSFDSVLEFVLHEKDAQQMPLMFDDSNIDEHQLETSIINKNLKDFSVENNDFSTGQNVRNETSANADNTQTTKDACIRIFTNLNEANETLDVERADIESISQPDETVVGKHENTNDKNLPITSQTDEIFINKCQTNDENLSIIPQTQQIFSPNSHEPHNERKKSVDIPGLTFSNAFEQSNAHLENPLADEVELSSGLETPLDDMLKRNQLLYDKSISSPLNVKDFVTPNEDMFEKDVKIEIKCELDETTTLRKDGESSSKGTVDDVENDIFNNSVKSSSEKIHEKLDEIDVVNTSGKKNINLSESENIDDVTMKDTKPMIDHRLSSRINPFDSEAIKEFINSLNNHSDKNNMNEKSDDFVENIVPKVDQLETGDKHIVDACYVETQSETMSIHGEEINNLVVKDQNLTMKNNVEDFLSNEIKAENINKNACSNEPTQTELKRTEQLMNAVESIDCLINSQPNVPSMNYVPDKVKLSNELSNEQKNELLKVLLFNSDVNDKTNGLEENENWPNSNELELVKSEEQSCREDIVKDGCSFEKNNDDKKKIEEVSEQADCSKTFKDDLRKSLISDSFENLVQSEDLNSKVDDNKSFNGNAQKVYNFRTNVNFSVADTSPSMLLSDREELLPRIVSGDALKQFGSSSSENKVLKHTITSNSWPSLKAALDPVGDNFSFNDSNHLTIESRSSSVDSISSPIKGRFRNFIVTKVEDVRFDDGGSKPSASTGVVDECGEDEEDGKREETETSVEWEQSPSSTSSSSDDNTAEYIWTNDNTEFNMKLSKLPVEKSFFESTDFVPKASANVVTSESDSESDSDDPDDDDISEEFVPSSWNSDAIPIKSLLKIKKNDEPKKKSVCFKKQRYHCVYEYPREESTSTHHEDHPWAVSSSSCTTINGGGMSPMSSSFVDWDMDEMKVSDGADLDTGRLVHPAGGGRGLSSFEFDFTPTFISDDGEFFISSSLRPFHGDRSFLSGGGAGVGGGGTSSEFYVGDFDASVGGGGVEGGRRNETFLYGEEAPSPKNSYDRAEHESVTSFCSSEDDTPSPSPSSPKVTDLSSSNLYPSVSTSHNHSTISTLGELCHTKPKLKLDLVSPLTRMNDFGGGGDAQSGVGGGGVSGTSSKASNPKNEFNFLKSTISLDFLKSNADNFGGLCSSEASNSAAGGGVSSGKKYRYYNEDNEEEDDDEEITFVKSTSYSVNLPNSSSSSSNWNVSKPMKSPNTIPSSLDIFRRQPVEFRNQIETITTNNNGINKTNEETITDRLKSDGETVVDKIDDVEMANVMGETNLEAFINPKRTNANEKCLQETSTIGVGNESVVKGDVDIHKIEFSFNDENSCKDIEMGHKVPEETKNVNRLDSHDVMDKLKENVSVCEKKIEDSTTSNAIVECETRESVELRLSDDNCQDNETLPSDNCDRNEEVLNKISSDKISQIEFSCNRNDRLGEVKNEIDGNFETVENKFVRLENELDVDNKLNRVQINAEESLEKTDESSANEIGTKLKKGNSSFEKVNNDEVFQTLCKKDVLESDNTIARKVESVLKENNEPRNTRDEANAVNLGNDHACGINLENIKFVENSKYMFENNYRKAKDLQHIRVDERTKDSTDKRIQRLDEVVQKSSENDILGNVENLIDKEKKNVQNFQDGETSKTETANINSSEKIIQKSDDENRIDVNSVTNMAVRLSNVQSSDDISRCREETRNHVTKSIENDDSNVQKAKNEGQAVNEKDDKTKVNELNTTVSETKTDGTPNRNSKHFVEIKENLSDLGELDNTHSQMNVGKNIVSDISKENMLSNIENQELGFKENGKVDDTESRSHINLDETIANKVVQSNVSSISETKVGNLKIGQIREEIVGNCSKVESTTCFESLGNQSEICIENNSLKIEPRINNAEIENVDLGKHNLVEKSTSDHLENEKRSTLNTASTIDDDLGNRNEDTGQNRLNDVKSTVDCIGNKDENLGNVSKHYSNVKSTNGETLGSVEHLAVHSDRDLFDENCSDQVTESSVENDESDTSESSEPKNKLNYATDSLKLQRHCVSEKSTA